ncbi:hypothetical protein SMICM17S_11379 [Streptomyces microflavus]
MALSLSASVKSLMTDAPSRALISYRPLVSVNGCGSARLVLARPES